MSDAAVTETWEFYLSQSPAALWPLLADVERLHEAMEMPRYTLAPEILGERRRLLARGGQGARGLEWEERPFEWVAGQWWRFERRFLKGPLLSLSVTLYLRRSAGGGSIAQYMLTAEPNGVIGKTLISSGYLRRIGDAFHRRAEEADDFLGGRSETPFRHRQRTRPREETAELDGRAAEMAKSPYANGAAATLAAMLAGAPESELAEIRVRRLARALDLPERAAAEACVAAAKAGMLERRFVVLCPRCRRAATRVDSIGALPAQGYCETDELEFPVDLAVNVEALFAPAPAVRPLGEGCFGQGGPMSAPHILLQQVLEPGERRAFPFQPRPGGYRVRVEDDDGRPLQAAEEESVHEKSFDYPGGGFPVVAATSGGVALGGKPPDEALIFENHAKESRMILLERREWRADAVTAAELAPLQAYRDLFADDAPAQPMRCGRAAFVAYLMGEREGVFARLGDLEAARRIERLSARAERMARARNGGVVRRQGERWLAAFLDPVDAVGFAVDLREAARAILGDAGAVEEDALGSGAPASGSALTVWEDHSFWRPQLALGVAGGRAVATNRGGRLDYTGFAPALAERLAEAADPGELAVSADLLVDAAVEERLAMLTRRDDGLAVPGVSENFAIVRAA